jgi:hypothetical protein
MQVFIVGSPLETAMALDKKRLNRQIQEAKVILDALNGTKAWSNHPCVLQYRGHEAWLMSYRDCLRYYYKATYAKNTVYGCAVDFDDCVLSNRYCNLITPSFHTKAYFDQMKRRLYAKDPVHYAQWAHLGESEDNWYFVDGEWRIYRNSKRIK